MTDIAEPTASYERFIARVIREYESLALIFRFITVDAEQSIHDQHREIRRLFREGEARPWSDWNLDAVVEWLAMRGARRVTRERIRLISIDGVNASALKTAARDLAAANRRTEAGISQWGASGIFDELTVADDGRGTRRRRARSCCSTPRTWPSACDGKSVRRSTRAASSSPPRTSRRRSPSARRLDSTRPGWPISFISRPPRPSTALIDPAPARQVADRHGFVEFCWQRLDNAPRRPDQAATDRSHASVICGRRARASRQLISARGRSATAATAAREAATCGVDERGAFAREHAE